MTFCLPCTEAEVATGGQNRGTAPEDFCNTKCYRMNV